jgi:hypothetical protein
VADVRTDDDNAVRARYVLAEAGLARVPTAPALRDNMFERLRDQAGDSFLSGGVDAFHAATDHSCTVVRKERQWPFAATVPTQSGRPTSGVAAHVAVAVVVGRRSLTFVGIFGVAIITPGRVIVLARWMGFAVRTARDTNVRDSPELQWCHRQT